MKNSIYTKLLIALAFVAIIFTAVLKTKAQESRLPAPDFSEMEKYYEITKWTYSDDGVIKMLIKPKNAAPQIHRLFTMRFFDADGIDLQYKYNICCPGYNQPAGEVERVETPAPEESKLKTVKGIIVYRILDDGSLVGPKPGQARNTNAPNNSRTNETAKRQTDAQPNAAQNKNSAGCDYTAQPATGTTARFSEALAKSALYERYSFETNTGGLSSPLALGVTYLNIELKPSYTNTVTVAPGRGAQRRYDGAPVDATIYPFHAKYIVCRKYSNTIRRTQYDTDNSCFKDKNDRWNCPSDGQQVTELN